jgi:nucleoside-diphosphate-sugar epimerase
LARYLVTGAAGFIGRSIAAALLARGDSVRGIDNFITGKRANLDGLEAMEFLEGDLADPAACAKACAGVEIVFHEAALASVPRSVADPVSTNVVLRYFNVFGPYQDPTSHYSGVLAIFCRKMLAGEQPTLFGDGEQSRDFTYVDNVVHGNLLAAAAPTGKVSGQMMNLATGTSITLNQTFEILCELTGYSGKPVFAEERTGDIRDSLADIRLAGNLLGYRPVVDFREGLQRTVEWYGAGVSSVRP